MKKIHFKRGLALLTTLALSASLILTPALAYGAGTELHKSVTTITEDLQFVNTVTTHSSGRQESYALEYTPGTTVSPVVWSGTNLTTKATILQGAEALTAQGYYVVGGINADFFASSSGVPMGLTIQDGRVVSSNDGRTAVAFRADGTAFTTNANLEFVLTNHGGGDPATGFAVTADDTDTASALAETLTADNADTAAGDEVPAPPDSGENGETGSTETGTTETGTAETGTGTTETGTAETGTTDTGTAASTGSNAGQVVKVHYYNKMRQSYYLYLLNSEFGSTNQATEMGRNVLFRILDGNEVTVSGTVSLEVVALEETASPTAIPEGYLLLTANAKSPYYDELTKFAIGDKVTLSVTTTDSRLADAVCAVGAGDVLVQNGTITDPSTWDSAIAFSRNPRTAIGIKEDGTVVFYVVDGRKSNYSNGLTQWDLAEELVQQGCVTVVNLDGGGSSTFLFREADSETYTIVNSPSDGSARKCSTFIYFVVNTPSDGVAKNLYFTNQDSVVLAGSQLDYTGMVARDSGYRLTETPSDVAIDLSADTYHLGYVENGIFYVGTTAGTAVLEAESETAYGSTTATIVTEADSLTVTRADTGEQVSALYLDPGQTVQLNVSAVAKGENALSSASSYTFSSTGDAGTIDSQGIFTASGVLGTTGTITISFGSKTVTITVRVGEEETVLLENFEGSSTIFTSADSAKMYVTDGADWVAKGERAGVLVYDFSLNSTGDYYLPTPVTITNAASLLSAWVKGDGSGATLSLLIRDADGTERVVPFSQTLTFSDYQQLTAPISAKGNVQILGFRISDTGQTTGKGAVCIDQIMLPGTASLTESTAPTISLSCSNGTLTAQLSDDSDIDFNASMVSVAVDGEEIPFTIQNNVVTASYTLNGEGIVNGVDASHFDPNGEMTRAAFCTMLSRYLGLDTSAYENVQLPFADLSDIPDWALPHVKAMYALGYVGGRDQGDGTTVFAADASITRAEIFTLLGRMSPKGFEESCSVTFTDQASIPDWALSGVKIVAAMGVVDGYEDGTVRASNTATRAEVAKILFYYY